MMKVKNFAVVYIQALFMFGCASSTYANEGCPSHFGKNYSLDDIINRSESIALYVALDDFQTTSAVIRSDNSPVETIEIRLNNVVPLKGIPDWFITVKALPVPKFVPPNYFSLDQYHKDFTDGSKNLFGTNLNWIQTKEGVCVNLPLLIPGYSYLVFDDKFSILGFEPILSTEYDSLYKEIQTRLGSQ